MVDFFLRCVILCIAMIASCTLVVLTGFVIYIICVSVHDLASNILKKINKSKMKDESVRAISKREKEVKENLLSKLGDKKNRQALTDLDVTLAMMYDLFLDIAINKNMLSQKFMDEENKED